MLRPLTRQAVLCISVLMGLLAPLAGTARADDATAVETRGTDPAEEGDEGGGESLAPSASQRVSRPREADVPPHLEPVDALATPPAPPRLVIHAAPLFGRLQRRLLPAPPDDASA